MRKYSYRKLDKRRFAKNILFYLQYPTEAKTIFTFTNLSERDRRSIETAYQVAEVLKDEYANGYKVNLSAYAPYVKEIKSILLRKATPAQAKLFADNP